jgi:hypothetical protein
MAVLCWAGSTTQLDLGRVTLAGDLFWPGFWLVWMMCMGYIAYSGGATKLLGNLAAFLHGVSEYTFRREYNQLVAETGRALAYICGEMGHALDPFLIAYGMLYRRHWCFLAGILGQFLIFGLTGLKFVLISGLFLALVAVLAKHYRKSFGVGLAFALTCCILLCTVVDGFTHNVYMSSLFTRRVLLVPGLFTGIYYEHYSQVGPVGLGLHFSHDPSVLTPANEIGFVYYHNAQTNANANLWAEGYAELGLLGMFAFTLFTAALIWLYDSLAAKRDLVLAVMLAAMPAVVVSNTSPTTVLLSWGGLAAGILLYLSPRPEPAPALNLEKEQREDGPVPAAGLLT